MPDEVLDATLNALEQMPFVKTVRLSGGEPTLHPRFTEVAQRLMSMGKRVIVYTNGWWAKTPAAALDMYEKLYAKTDMHAYHNYIEDAHTTVFGQQRSEPNAGWVEIRVSYNNDLLKAQPDTLDHIVNIAHASNAYRQSLGQRVPLRGDRHALTQFSVSTRGENYERTMLEDQLFLALRPMDLYKRLYKIISLPFVKAGKSTKGITVQPKEQAEDSKLLLVNPEGTVFSSRVEAHESLGLDNQGESRVGKITNSNFTENLKRERIARFPN